MFAHVNNKKVSSSSIGIEICFMVWNIYIYLNTDISHHIMAVLMGGSGVRTIADLSFEKILLNRTTIKKSSYKTRLVVYDRTPFSKPHGRACISYHITSHYTTPHYTTPRHVTSGHITPHHITSHHITPHNITSHHIKSHHITSHHTSSHHITSHKITPHHITLHHITLTTGQTIAASVCMCSHRDWGGRSSESQALL